jgi:hypothetical protein
LFLFGLTFVDFPKFTSFSNLEILVSLLGEISPEGRNPSRVQLLSLSLSGWIHFAFLEQSKALWVGPSKEGTRSYWLLLSPESQ